MYTNNLPRQVHIQPIPQWRCFARGMLCLRVATAYVGAHKRNVYSDIGVIYVFFFVSSALCYAWRS